MGADEPGVDEIRGVFRLINQCCEQWDEPAAWQGVLAHGIREILGGGVGLMQFASPGASPDEPEVIPIVSAGWASEEKEALWRASLVGEERAPLPGFGVAMGPAMREGSIAVSRSMCCPDDAWYGSVFFRRFVEPAGMDEFALGMTVAPQLGSVVMVGGNRELGAERIPARTVQLLGILAEEIAPLLGTRLSLEGQVSKAGLTSRQRQTLEHLLNGLSEKQVARELGLSPATVHDYVVKLHKHFDVSTRGELLSYFIKRKPKASE